MGEEIKKKNTMVVQEDVVQDEVIQEDVVPRSGQEQFMTPGQVYLRLSGTYEGDVKIDDDTYQHSFLLHLTSMDGSHYIAPVYCHPNFYEGMKKMLPRMLPLTMVLSDPETVPKSDGPAEVVKLTGAPTEETKH